MKYFIALLILFIFPLLAIGQNFNPNYPLTPSQYNNGEAFQKAFSIASASTYSNIFALGSVDPFSTKTNKYAESRVIRVVVPGGQAYISMGPSNLPSASTGDFLLASGTDYYFVVQPNKAYVRLRSYNQGEIATPNWYVTELK